MWQQKQIFLVSILFKKVREEKGGGLGVVIRAWPHIRVKYRCSNLHWQDSIYNVSFLTDAIMRTISVGTVSISITYMAIIVAFINIYENNLFAKGN